MKKIILFIGIPFIILLFGILNAVLLFSPPTGFSYNFKENDVVYSIRITHEEYFIESKISNTKQLLDHGTAERKDGRIIFKSKTSNMTPNIQIKDAFKLKYDGNTFHCGTAIFLQAFYAILITAGFTALVFTLIKYRN